jgi:hypothetical protein
VAGRKRRRGYGCGSLHPPINGRLPNATVLDAIAELDEIEQEKDGRRVVKRRRVGLGSEAIRLPGKTWEEWREDALMDLNTVVFATNVMPNPVPEGDSYPTSPTSPAGANALAAGLVSSGEGIKETLFGGVVRVG